MAAFSRGPALAARCCRGSLVSSTLRLPIDSSQHSILQPLNTFFRSFSQSTRRDGKKAQRKPNERLSPALQRVQEQIAGYEKANARADKIRALKRQEMIRAFEEEQALQQSLVAQQEQEQQAMNALTPASTDATGAPTTEATTTAEQQQEGLEGVEVETTAPAAPAGPVVLPLNPYRSSTSDHRQSLLPEQLEEELRTREIAKVTRELLYKGENTVIYQAPRRRWQLGAASVALSAAGLGLVALIMYWVYLTLDEESSWLFQLVYAATMAFGSALVALAYRRRSQYVKQITLVPQMVGRTAIINLEVTGSSYWPLRHATLRRPQWAVRTNRPVHECVAEPAPAERPLGEFYPALQPFVWLTHAVSGVWREMKLVLLAPHGRQLTRLYLEEGNTGPLSSWSVDARGKFWRSPDAFDYLIKVDPDAKGNWFMKGSGRRR